MEQTSLIISKSETQGGKNMICSVNFPQLNSMHCTIYAKEVTFPTITNLFSPFTSYESCLGCQHLISNRTNQLRSKLANQKRRHMSLSNTILCSNSQTLQTEGVERLSCRLLKGRLFFRILFVQNNSN